MAVKGGKAQAIGLSRGGQTSKIHAVCDLPDHPVALALTAGHVCDIRAAELLTAEATRFRRLVADKGYDAGRINRKRPIRHDARRDRRLVEAMFGRLKDFRHEGLSGMVDDERPVRTAQSSIRLWMTRRRTLESSSAA